MPSFQARQDQLSGQFGVKLFHHQLVGCGICRANRCFNACPRKSRCGFCSRPPEPTPTATFTIVMRRARWILLDDVVQIASASSTAAASELRYSDVSLAA